MAAYRSLSTAKAKLFLESRAASAAALSKVFIDAASGAQTIR
jgi:hypothetical protein